MLPPKPSQTLTPTTAPPRPKSNTPHRTHQAKVADAQLAVSVEQEVGGLEVAVHHPRGVQVLQAAQQLVDKELDVLLCRSTEGVGGWVGRERRAGTPGRAAAGGQRTDCAPLLLGCLGVLSRGELG